VLAINRYPPSPPVENSCAANQLKRKAALDLNEELQQDAWNTKRTTSNMGREQIFELRTPQLTKISSFTVHPVHILSPQEMTLLSFHLDLRLLKDCFFERLYHQTQR